MMKLSTKGRYGLRAMIDLALHYEARKEPLPPIMMSDIARRQGVSRKYLHALLTPLKDAGLIQSTRGARGGYFLAKSPEQITLGDILVALEGELCIVECASHPERCKRIGGCQAHGVWTELNDVVNQKMRQITLEQIVHTEEIRPFIS